MTKIDLSNISTNDLRLELKRRISLEKNNKDKRIDELKQIITKATKELENLGSSPLKNNKKQKVTPADLKSPPPGIPSIIDAIMPKNIKKSINNNSKENNRCSNCGATPSNWEYSPKDSAVYCVCGNMIMIENEIHGNNFR